jgi:hypothetical protein
MHCRKILALAAFGISSVINPGYFAACASTPDSENTPDYTAKTAELEEVVLAASDSYDVDIDGASYRLDVDVEPVRGSAAHAWRPEHAFTQTAHACGTHKLVATAHACIDSFEMDVTGHVALLRAANGGTYEEVGDVAVTGSLEAISSAIATLTLQFADGRVVLKRQSSNTFVPYMHDLQALLD